MLIYLFHLSQIYFYFQNEYFHYDPQGVSDSVLDPDTNERYKRQPIEQIGGTPGDRIIPGTSFIELARTRGIIFMYENSKDKPDFEVTF